MTQSATSMYDCTHGPKEDCHACMVGELAAALKRVLPYAEGYDPAEYGGEEPTQDRDILDARAVLEKAKQMDATGACIPWDDIKEASQ